MRTSRSRQRRRVRRTVFAFAVLGLLYLGAWWSFSVRSSSVRPAWLSLIRPSRANADQTDLSWTQGNLSQNLSLLAMKSVSSPLTVPHRVVYPYSIIPGGVRTPDDLREVSEHDRVVGSHYAGFDFRNARIVELDQPKLVYLSYRMGDKVFWTGKENQLTQRREADH